AKGEFDKDLFVDLDRAVKTVPYFFNEYLKYRVISNLDSIKSIEYAKEIMGRYNSNIDNLIFGSIKKQLYYVTGYGLKEGNGPMIATKNPKLSFGYDV